MDPLICPSILADSDKQYRQQIERVAAFAHRLQIDLTDGQFAPHKTVGIEQVWWPVGVKADIHLMYAQPGGVIAKLLDHKPNLLILHAEAKADFKQIYAQCQKAGVSMGMALLPHTQPEAIEQWLHQLSHVLIFSGELGEYGGHANLNLLEKAAKLKQLNPELEIGWDGGVNDQNIAALVTGGVDVLDVGGFIQNSSDPARTFEALQRIADETGTT